MQGITRPLVAMAGTSSHGNLPRDPPQSALTFGRKPMSLRHSVGGLAPLTRATYDRAKRTGGEAQVIGPQWRKAADRPKAQTKPRNIQTVAGNESDCVKRENEKAHFKVGACLSSRRK